MFHREIIVTKLQGFAAGVISKNEIYEWALFVAVSREYEELIKEDQLAEKIIQFLIEINNQREVPPPLKEIAQYFLDCLDEKRTYSQAEFDAFLKPEFSGVVPAPKKAVPAPEKKKTVLPQFDLTPVLKGYVLVFVGLSILLNLFTALSPNFLVRPGEIAPTAAEGWKGALPHLGYGIVMLLALLIRVPRFVFYGIFFVAVLGMFFYWYVATDILLKNGRSLAYLLVLAPFITLPPTAGFFLMLDRWFAEMPKPKRPE